MPTLLLQEIEYKNFKQFFFNNFFLINRTVMGKLVVTIRVPCSVLRNIYLIILLEKTALALVLQKTQFTNFG